jgi:hypothetical protein
LPFYIIFDKCKRRASGVGSLLPAKTSSRKGQASSAILHKISEELCFLDSRDHRFAKCMNICTTIFIHDGKN